MAYKKTIYKAFISIFMVSRSVAVLAEDVNLCDPKVNMDVQEASLSQLVINLAEKYQFETSFPVALNKKITMKESAGLEDILKSLTRGMSTIIRKQYRVACEGEAITELYFLPTGQKTDYINSVNENSRKKVDYIYIDNMNEYVKGVLLGEHRADKRFMVPEQRKEYEEVKRKLRKQMKGQRKKVQKPKREHD